MNAIADPVAPVFDHPRSNGTVEHPLPDPYAEGDDDKLFEVIRGKRVEKTMGLVQNRIAAIMYRMLANFCFEHDLGHVDIEAHFSIPGSGNDRRPDVAFVSFQKWPKEKPLPNVNAWSIAPDLAVEVICPSDKAFDVLEKVHEYFAGGVRQVWEIYSNLQQVLIYTSPTTIRILAKSDELHGDPLIPGFRIPVADLFPLTEPKSES